MDNTIDVASADSLIEFVECHPRLFVLTGAGCSTDSGIPDYRDAAGEWKRRPPITYQLFVGNEHARKRYWARSLVGFRRMRHARPNDAHHSLASLEQRGRVESARSATTGLTRAARRAGNQQTSMATPNNVTAVAANTARSRGLTS